MAYALGQLGHEGILLLERILRESESPAALLAALGKISDFEEEARDSVPAVLPLIRSDDPRVRAEALTTLQSIGAAGSVTGDDLALVRGAVRDENPDVRSAAAGALSTVCNRDDAQCAADLIHMLQSDEEPWVRAEAAKALGVIGAGGHGVRDALTVAAKDPDSMISAQAREALSSIR
jgi:HEAT repeat protein